MSTIRFTINNDVNIKHTIILDNTIYLPTAANNFISTSQLSRDENDDYEILSGGKYSIFMWYNDNNRQIINHPPGCAIPLTPANE